ncbi:LysR family transcriptional regulator [Serratia rubidaea]|uniref:Gcv operon activator n=1 Tax=Serratia rubidaea TaxID=61652 RepID=A0A448SVK3_SERRU|nr:LysR family transcriptional regulator [Serratia rubidaea]MBH1928686.1 LysR family transcriptional regulator [Serratia rubidaea]MDC6119631.1 LysR family transcriptional regulator [Serratia rubidaea]MEB7584481.1 LysR family transcriptional regulator [Serratia rubidaea]VEI71845.1 Gcv operon activator [Serratia rubidaea]
MKTDKIGEPISRKIGRNISLGGLRCFEAAARLESFTQAAHSLSLTHGAISRAVRALENELGLALFERRHRRVYLTAAGRKLWQASQQAFDILEQSVQELYLQAQNAPIVLSCEPTLLMRWLIPRMPEFLRTHPAIHVQLVAGGGAVAFQDGITLAIRRNDFDWGASVHSIPLFSEKIGPVCKPEMLAQFVEGSQTEPRLRRDAALLQTATRPDAWADWAQAQGVSIEGMPQQRFEHFYFSLQAAVAGLGVAIGPWQQVRDDIGAGLLAAPFGFRHDGSGYSLLTPQPVTPGSAAETLLHWLQRQAMEL